ncbi:hypothetical protein O181_028351 [Austropuccinia psidii MF-1]|uniref:Uncharacterized protein n=1 Tax=Austropuccinia psidii MF-1 TaxID=1389203 RepID=A0A9Q3H2A5_9BASI|nr:hypothetical protein [Austropuccinia psidii MF-1]
MRLRFYPPHPPSQLLMPPPPAACNPYPPAAPSRIASDTALNPAYASAPLPLTILTLPHYIHSVRWLLGVEDKCCGISYR